MSFNNVSSGSDSPGLEDDLKITVSVWLSKAILAQCQHKARNIERHGVLIVEDFDHLKKEEFDAAIENLDSSMRVIEVRRAKAEHQKAHHLFGWKTNSTTERSSRVIPDTSLSCITAR